MKNIAIVFDCGATNVRVIALNDKGKILASESLPNETDEDPNLRSGKIWAIDKLWNKLCVCSKLVVSKINVEDIAGISFTTFGVDGGFVDEKGKLLYPVVSWQCDRTLDMLEKLNTYIPSEKVYNISGVFPYSYNTIYKMVWFKENRPELFDLAHKFLFLPSLLINNISGEMVNDSTMLGTSMLTNLSKQNLSDEILNALGIEKELFGEIKNPGEKIGKVNKEGFESTGLPEGIPVFLAGHDTQFAIYGSGANVNDFVLSSGTWEILMGRSKINSVGKENFKNNLTTEFDSHTGIYNIGQNWLGSGVLEWFFKNFYPELKGKALYITTEKEAENIPDGANGIMFNPGFYDDGCGMKGGSIKGLTIHTKREEIFKALLESLSFRLREGIEDLELASGTKAKKIVCVGGGSKWNLWNKLRADICQLPIQTIDQKETTVLGASFFIFSGSGLHSSPEKARNQIDYNEKIIYPDSSMKTFWDELYKKYLESK